jgi:hypothetical protein
MAVSSRNNRDQFRLQAVAQEEIWRSELARVGGNYNSGGYEKEEASRQLGKHR